MEKTMVAETVGELVDGGRAWLSIGYDRSKGYRERFEFRLMTAAEAAALSSGARCWFLALDGTARGARINGRPRTWKTRPGDVDVPVKYGMYEHGTTYYRGGVGDSRGALLLVATDGTGTWSC